jgi:hypothetical protein
MTIRKPQFPAQVWDGTANDRGSRNLEIDPQHPSYDQIVAEVIATQQFALSLTGSSTLPYSAEAGVNLLTGQVVYLDLTGRLQKAVNNTAAGAQVAGMMVTDALAGVSGDYVTDNTLELPDWSSIAGTADLTPGATYYLDSTEGKITTIAPTADGYYVVVIGRAQSTTKLDIELEQPIRL